MRLFGKKNKEALMSSTKEVMKRVEINEGPKIEEKKNTDTIVSSPTKEVVKSVEIIERPRMCCIDLQENTIFSLKASGANVYEGTLGSKIKVPNTTRRESHQLLLNCDFPSNLHEFDIIIIDLDGFKTIDYEPEKHIKQTHTGKSSLCLLSSYPETLFDPRPISSFILKGYLQQITNRPYLALAFSSRSYVIDYEPVVIYENHTQKQEIEKYNIYSFWDYVPFSESIYGEQISVVKMRNDLQTFLEKYTSGATYNQTFNHPYTWEGNKKVYNDNYFPLMKNMSGDIISYIETSKNGNLIILPQIKDKSNFLLEFLSKIAPSLYPEIFPYSTAFNWKKQKEYWLPKYSELLEEKSNIQKEYEGKINECERKIKENHSKFSFLHEMITETGDPLKRSLINYLKWLGFDSIRDFDEMNPESKVLEEDIQVELPNGLLIIECKGIGGTSTDSDCSQISKIKYRRCEERGEFDVYALYIVNHQRYLPPLKRQNPPFTEHQIRDAKNEKRGLLSTWQLFNLYFDIENKTITKEETRKSILEFGLVDFRPKGLTYVYEPTEFYKEGTICIVNVDNILLSVNDELVVEKNGKFEKVRVVDIKVNDSSVQQASQGELGLKLSSKIRKKSIIWKKDRK